MTVVLNTTIRPEVLRGRGALSNAVGRYEKQTRVLVDDGWDDGWRADDDAPPPLRTEVIHDATRTIIARNKSPDISFDQSINPYRGCEHGCIYCFARPTHAYLGMSPGVDFESRLFAKPNAAELLAKELSRARLCAQGDRHRHQHRSLSAARKEDAHHALASWKCCAISAIPSASSPSRR